MDEKKLEKQGEAGAEKSAKKETIGIKLPWWIGYTLLIIIIVSAFFLIYKVFTKYKTIETIAKIDDSVFTINLDKDTIEAGETIKIETTKYKENVTLISSNPEIIKTEGDTIIGVAEGEATIYASYNEEKSNELTLKCIVNLNEIVLDKSELEIVIGGEQKIIATLVPENSTYKELNWQSSDNSIATVEDGLVKGCKEGRATITVTEINTKKEAKCNVTVKPIEVESISLDEKDVKLGVGKIIF